VDFLYQPDREIIAFAQPDPATLLTLALVAYAARQLANFFKLQ